MASHGEWALFSLNNPWKLSKQSVSFSSESVYRSYVPSNLALYEFCCTSITVMGKMSEFEAVLFYVTP